MEDKWAAYKKKQKEDAEKSGFAKPGALTAFERGVRQESEEQKPKKDRFQKIKAMFGV